MEGTRVQALDNLAESLAEIRGQQAMLRADEASNLQTALSLLKKHDLNSYKFSTIEYLRSPGEEKIRARIVKERSAMAGRDVDATDTAVPGDDPDLPGDADEA